MSSNQNHAYLIMAHHNFDQLKCLIRLLDHPGNDIYLHVDKRASGFRPEEFRTEHSLLTFVERIRVNWAGHSQIQCELNLLQAAVPGEYRYYHLISGVDLPLKTQDEIHRFFESDASRNYIQFSSQENITQSFLPRIRYYHFFQDYLGRNKGPMYAVLGKTEHLLVQLQQGLNIRRKQYVQPYKGANWFSINHDLAQHILSQRDVIRKQFFHSYCADEVFLHSIAMASPYRDSIVDNSLRAIDWNRGNPYVYRLQDVDELMASGKLFARKFDERIDQAAIDEVVRRLHAREQDA